MVKREKYIKEIREFYESDLVKVITGIRRSGKSVILTQIMDEIKEVSDNIIYLNFEKSEDLSKAGTINSLLDYVSRNRKNGKCYVFLDEVQEVENWQTAVKDLRLGDNSLFITGSNSKILSSEIRHLLSGRYVNLRVRPMVYKEALSLYAENGHELSVADYLIWGGFPQRLSFFSEEAIRKYLGDLRETIVYNDLIKRYKIKKVVPFIKIVNYVMRNNSRILSARNIHARIRNECENVSLNTVLKYIECLKEAYIIDQIPQYSSKAKKELSYYQKVYVSDVGLNSLLAENSRYDLDHNMENIVYNELLYRGYSLKVYENQGREIDFYASKGGKSYFVQVAYSVYDEKAYQREFSAFEKLDQRTMKILITNDEIDYSTSLVKHIRLKDFLLMDEF